MDQNNYQNQFQVPGFAPAAPKRELFIQGLPLLAVIPFIQGLLLWLCLSDFLEEVFGLYELNFPLPITACLLTPLFLYLNWDFWRQGSRRLLLSMALGLGILFILSDLYAFWREMDKFDYIIEMSFFLGLAMVISLPVFRQRLYASGSKDGRVQAEASVFKEPPAEEFVSPYSDIPETVRPWFPGGRFYLEELLRVSILLCVALIACAIVNLFVFLFSEMLHSIT